MNLSATDPEMEDPEEKITVLLKEAKFYPLLLSIHNNYFLHIKYGCQKVEFLSYHQFPNLY